MKNNLMKKNKEEIILYVVAYTTITIFAICAVFPFLLVLSGSFSSNQSIAQNGYSLFPREFSLQAYIIAFKQPQKIFNAYKISILVTLCGTILSVAMCAMTGYVLSRKDYKYRNKISFFFFFTTIFSGGLVPWYILCVKYLNFKTYPLIALVVPGLFSYFYTIIMRSFMSSIPASISESAKIDGANDFSIFVKLILPLSKPVLATVGLFSALNYWNDWFNAMLFVNREEFYPLQYFLYGMLNNVKALSQISSSVNIPMSDMPTETFKLAMTIVTISPIVLLYPFLQKYFIKGMTLGAVKG